MTTQDTHLSKPSMAAGGDPNAAARTELRPRGTAALVAAHNAAAAGHQHEPLLSFDPDPLHIIMAVFGIFTLVFAVFGRVLKVPAHTRTRGTRGRTRSNP